MSADFCIDCGGPDPGCPDGRCRDCDVEYVTVSGACRACAVWIMNPEFVGVSVEEQHAPMCPLRNDPAYYPRDETELKILRVRRLRGDTGLPWPECLPPMFPEVA